ncbi:MAG: hypothetical protein JSS65_06675 [Armatimonadetes bacterium]|nr:hypothetical protein [Armatimonadota bacterium]
MRRALALLAAIAATSMAMAQQPANGKPFNVTFSGAELNFALKALSLTTGANIVVSGADKTTVTLSVTVNTTDEAVRAVASAAGVLFRKVGNTYVVAPEANLKKALEPFAKRANLEVDVKDPATLVSKLRDALPYASVTMLAGKVNVLGVPEDIDSAKEIASEYARTEVDSMEVSEAVLLTYAKGKEVAELLTGLYPKVKVSSSTGEGGGGAVGLYGPASMVRAAKDLAQQLDARSDNRDSETTYHVYQLKYASAPTVVEFFKGKKEEPGIMPDVEAFVAPESFSPKRATFNPLTAQLSSGSGFFGGGASGGGGNGGGGGLGGQQGGQQQGGQQGGVQTQTVKGDRSKAVILKGRKTSVDKALTLLAQLDVKPQQVVIEVNIIETTPENSTKTGIDWTWSPFDFHELPAGTGIADNPAGGSFTKSIETKPVGIGQFSRTPSNFRAILQGMVTRSEAKILARPSLTVIDNDQASFFIGNTIRARITSQGALGAQNVQIQEFPVGIILLIAPRVNADGNITLHVNPVVSTVTAVDSDNVPQTAAREAETTTVIKDGETIVIGGLIRDDELKTISEIPILSKIPILGELFRSRTTSHKKTDLIFSITPHIVKETGPGGK